MSARIAEVYARSAFSVAKEEGSVADWLLFLESMTPIFSLPEVCMALAHPRMGPVWVANLLLPLMAQLPASRRHWLRLLAERGRLVFWPQIAAEFRKLHEKDSRRLSVRAIGALPWPADLLDQLADALSSRYGVKVHIESSVDPSLLGGAVVQVGDEVIDGSLRRRLMRLREHMMGV